MSARLSTGLPRACSGLMYAAVPRIIPACVIAGDVIVGEFIASAVALDVRVERLGETEVQHLHRAVTSHLDVRGLQIAMDDPLLVRRLERLGDLLRDGQRFVERDRALRDALREVVAFDQLHHERQRAAGLLDGIDRGDVRMVQRRECLGFTLEARQAVEVRGKRLGQDLDGHLATERGVGRAPHLPHSAFAEGRGDLVDAESGAGGEAQVVEIIRAGGASSRAAAASRPCGRDVAPSS